MRWQGRTWARQLGYALIGAAVGFALIASVEAVRARESPGLCRQWHPELTMIEGTEQ
jgi:hypothetical protein